MSSSQSACLICFLDFDDKRHQALSLHCGHVYCTQCLWSLQTANSKKCPLCLHDWQECDTELLQICCAEKKDVHDGASNEKSQILEHTSGSNLPQVFKKLSGTCNTEVLCSNHSMPFCYFCDHCKQFSCMRCVISKQPHCTFIMISDALTLIKSSVAAKCKAVKFETESDLGQLQIALSEIMYKMVSVNEFSKELEDIKQKLSCLTESLETVKLKRYQDLLKVTELESAIAEIDSDNVITEVHSCLDALKIVHSGQINSLKFPEMKSLLCFIVCAFKETSQLPTSDCSETEHFITKLRVAEDAPHQKQQRVTALRQQLPGGVGRSNQAPPRALQQQLPGSAGRPQVAPPRGCGGSGHRTAQRRSAVDFCCPS